MEMVAFRTEVVAAKRLIVSTFVVETALAAQRSMLCLFLLADVLLKSKDGLLDLIGGDQRFPVDELHRMKRPETENVDGSDTEDDEEDDDDVEQDDDEGDEDFSGEEEGGEDDEEGDPEEDPVANGNGGSDDEDDEDEDGDGDGDEDEDGEDEDDEEEDEDEEDAPPAKKRK